MRKKESGGTSLNTLWEGEGIITYNPAENEAERRVASEEDNAQLGAYRLSEPGKT